MSEGQSPKMTEEARAAAAAYVRAWRRKNPDKIRTYYRKYWEKKAAEWAAEIKQREQKNSLGGEE